MEESVFIIDIEAEFAVSYVLLSVSLSLGMNVGHYSNKSVQNLVQIGFLIKLGLFELVRIGLGGLTGASSSQKEIWDVHRQKKGNRAVQNRFNFQYIKLSGILHP